MTRWTGILPAEGLRPRRGGCHAGSVSILIAVATLATPGKATSAPPAVQVGDTLTLEQVVREALALDPTVAGAQAGAASAAADVRIAESARLPSLASSARAVRFEEPMVVAPIHALDLANAPEFDRTLLQGRLELGYTLWDGGARAARIGGARASETTRQAVVRSTRQDAIAEVVDGYLAVLTARDVLAAQGARLTELQAERDRVARFLEEGTAPRLDLLRAEAELSAALADETAAAARLERAEFLLASLLERAPGEIAGTELRDVAVVAGVPPGGEPDVLSGHPALAAATSRVEAARSAVRARRAAWLPALHASGALVEYGGGSSDYTGEWQAGIRVDYPLFTGGARRAEVERARAQVRGAEAELRSVRRDLERAVDAARSAEREALARVESLTDAVERFEELARVEALALDEGVGVQRDFLLAQAGLLQVRAGLAEARRDAVLAQVRLARALGGLTPEWIARTLEPLS